jgi:hypothetical protein
MHAIHLVLPSSVGVDPEALGLALERRLQARVARADSGVEITAELLSGWAKEELADLVEQVQHLRRVASAHALS